MKKVAFVLGLLAPILAFAQIQITSSEIPGAIGINWTSDLNNGTSVSVGDTGGPHIWDLTSYSAGSDTLVDTIVDKNNYAFKDSFPSANYVQLKVDFQDPKNSGRMYYRLATDSLSLLGRTIVPDTSIGVKVVRFTPPAYVKLPIAYGDQGVINSSGTFGIVMGGFPFTVNMNVRAHLKVDGYGQVKIPYKTFDCLRVLHYDTVIVAIPGITAETTRTIEYQFWAENYGQVAKITSMNNEIDPNFTTGNLERMVGSNIGIEEKNMPEQKTTSLYPNPFYNNVNIKYSLSNPGHVSLKIYDITGNLVRTLVNNSQPTGNHTMLWDGKNTNGTKVPAGIYFYELKTPTNNLMNKIILLK
jgi:hypothetical protein